MSRIRTVKPELFRHEGLFEAELHYQLPLRTAFIGLLTVCDREGRFRWQPRVLKLDVLPHDALDFGVVLEALAKSGFIVKYEHEGQCYGYIPTWRKHQCVNSKERKSALPDPLALLQADSAAEVIAPDITDTDINLDEPLLSEAHESLDFHGNSTEISMPENASLPTVDNRCIAESSTHDVIASPDTGNTTLASPVENSHETAPDVGLGTLAQKSTCFHMPYLDEHKKARGELEKEKEKELEEEQEQEKEGVWGRKNQTPAITSANVASEPRPRERDNPLLSHSFKAGVISDIFAHWQAALGHPNARLDNKRRKAISSALKLGYTPEELKQAISGCSVTPHNLGDNDRGQRYDGLQLILKDADQIDRFIKNYFSPPRPKTPAQRHTENNMNALNNWAARKQQELEEEARRQAHQGEVHHAA